MAATEDEELKDDPAFKDAAIFSLPEAGFGIQSRLEIATRTNPQFTPHPLVKKTVDYTTRFSVNRDPGALEAFRGYLREQTDLSQEEQCQITNLVPDSVEELKCLVPSIDDPERFEDDLLEEIPDVQFCLQVDAENSYNGVSMEDNVWRPKGPHLPSHIFTRVTVLLHLPMREDNSRRPQIVIVPSSTGFELLQQASPSRRKSPASKWTPPGSACSGLQGEVCRSLQTNFLLGGGGRAIDRQREDALLRMNAAAIKDLRRANAALAGELTRCKHEVAQDMKGLETEHAELKKHVAAERQHVGMLKEQLATLEEHKAAFKVKARSKLKDADRRLQQEHEARCRSNAEATSSCQKLEQAQQQLKEAQKRNSDLAAEKQKLQEKAIALEHKVHELRLENGGLCESVRQSDSGQASAADECQRLHQRIAEVEGQLRSAKEAVQDAKSKHPRLLTKIQELEASCRKRDGQLEATQAEMRGHQDQAADLSAAHEDLAHQVKRTQERVERMAWEAKAERERAAVLERQVNDLQQENRALTFQKEEAVGLQDITDARLRDIQEALRASQIAAAAAAEEVMMLQGKHAHSLAQLNANSKELSDYKLQNQELAESLHSATDQLAALQAVQGGDRRHLETRLAHVSHELEQSSAELSRCRQGSEAAEQGRSGAQQLLTGVREELRATRQMLEGEQAQCTRLRRELGAARQAAVQEADARQRTAADLAAATESEEALRHQSKRDANALRQNILNLDANNCEAGGIHDMNGRDAWHMQPQMSPKRPHRHAAALPNYEAWVDSVLRKSQPGFHGSIDSAYALNSRGF
ncbi:hypothetical protein WJX74_001641 [Apatococcus lobatus]|uniref:RNA polymerase Rpb4/RPC9 core domain-containing protein n=1 Tax=Apatococcus lobatus TaxID=904363 RepID=A0AAW1QYD8_9CHLO